MKIKKIEVKNFKAIDEQIAEFNGCSAIITAGNNKGKTSILNGLIERFRGEKPDLIVKDGESKGYNCIELTDGSRIEWKFTEKTESFSYTTKEGIKQTTGVLSTIGARYFGVKFDIDKFLNSGAQAQTKELQRLVGLDFAEIDARYKKAYAERADANKELKRIGEMRLEKPKEISEPNVKILTDELERINKANVIKQKEWLRKNKIHQNEIIAFNELQTNRRIEYNKIYECISFLKEKGYQSSELNGFLKSKEPDQKMELTSLKDPKYEATDVIQLRISEAQEQLRAFDKYKRDLVDYNKWIKEGEEARKNQINAEKNVKSIENEKRNLIASAKIPAEFEITEDGILYKGLPLTDNQISSSSKYIAALKLASMVLGEIRTMHFDASFLDKNSLSEIQSWANENDLQLLIERPDFDGGEIEYQIL